MKSKDQVGNDTFMASRYEQIVGPGISRSLRLVLLTIVVVLAANIQLADCQAGRLSSQQFPSGLARSQLISDLGYSNGLMGSQLGENELSAGAMPGQKRVTGGESDRSVDHVIESACRNFAASILTPRAIDEQIAPAFGVIPHRLQMGSLRDPKALELLDYIDQQERAKKANPHAKHTPRFG